MNFDKEIMGYSIREDNGAGTGLPIGRRVLFMQLTWIILFRESKRVTSKDQELRNIYA